MMTMTEARDRWTERYPELRSKALAYFQDKTPEAKQEAIANAFSLAWTNLVPLIERGQCDDTMITSTFYFALRATRSGRITRAVKHDHSRELWNHHRCIHAGLDISGYIADRDMVPDIVSFRVDTRAWLDSLPENQRKRAIEMGDGSDTKELAQRWHVSPSAVSQYRRQLTSSYSKFMHASE
jgi:hypothetical protein